ncbi:MAG: CinA family nicotinamide mononucleotide deamidase-related protein [Crocinitomicaceae bacterium]
MKADIITIGDEILIGQTIDTNSAWMGSELNKYGVSVRQITSISDNSHAIISTLENSLNEADFIFITGGLGPTKDDITKNVLTNYFRDELVLYQDICDEIEAYFTSVNRPFLEVNRQQAMLPKKAKIIRNDLGTASGMWFESMGKQVFSLPGVPYEMKGLVNKILPQLQEKFQLGDFYHCTSHFQGVPESILADTIEDIESEILKEKISIAYLPSTGIVKIRLTGEQHQKESINDFLSEIEKRFPKNFFGRGDITIQQKIAQLLMAEKKTLGTVESCTGGALAQRIVSTPGSSAYYKGSIISYAYELKEKMVDVNHDELWEHGAVSAVVVEQMAKGGIEKLNVDYCIATSGIAGPDGGTDEKPVGTIWMAIATKDKVYSKKFSFRQNRERNIESAVVYGLNYLRIVIENLEVA